MCWRGRDGENDHPLLAVGKQTMGNEEFILLLSLTCSGVL